MFDLETQMISKNGADLCVTSCRSSHEQKCAWLLVYNAVTVAE